MAKAIFVIRSITLQKNITQHYENDNMKLHNVILNSNIHLSTNKQHLRVSSPSPCKFLIDWYLMVCMHSCCHACFQFVVFMKVKGM